jgi:hypothetical protein
MFDENCICPPSPRTPWNKGKLIGAKPPLRPNQVWSIRTRLHMLCPISIGRFGQFSAFRKQRSACICGWGRKPHARVFTLAFAIASDRDDGGLLVPFKSCRNVASNRLRGTSQRIVIEMRIACGGRRLRVAQQATDDR